MKGEEEHKFDAFLRRSVGHYRAEPSPAVWKAILQKIPFKKPPPFSFGGGNAGWLGIMAGGMIIGSIFLYQWYRDSRDDAAVKPDPRETSLGIQEPPLAGVASLPEEKQTITLNPAEKQLDIGSSMMEQSSGAESKQASARAAEHATLANHAVLATPESGKRESLTNRSQDPGIVSTLEQITAAMDTDIPLQPADRPGSTPPQVSPAGQEVHAVSDMEGARPEPVLIASSDKSYYFRLSRELLEAGPKSGEWSPKEPRVFRIVSSAPDYFRTGPEYSLLATLQPEWLSAGNPNRYGQDRQKASVTLRWQNQAYRLEGGIGLVRESIRNNVNVYYSQLLGVVNRLVSITFDSLGTPTYHYAIDSVYDTRTHKTTCHTSTDITYLQLPLLFGMVEKKGRATFSVMTGPVMLLQLNHKETSYEVTPDKRVLITYSNAPHDVISAWQWHLGFGFEYALTERFGFYFEPALTASLNTPYEANQQYKPVYLGIRSGISVQLSGSKK